MQIAPSVEYGLRSLTLTRMVQVVSSALFVRLSLLSRVTPRVIHRARASRKIVASSYELRNNLPKRLFLVVLCRWSVLGYRHKEKEKDRK